MAMVAVCIDEAAAAEVVDCCCGVGIVVGRPGASGGATVVVARTGPENNKGARGTRSIYLTQYKRRAHDSSQGVRHPCS